MYQHYSTTLILHVPGAFRLSVQKVNKELSYVINACLHADGGVQRDDGNWRCLNSTLPGYIWRSIPGGIGPSKAHVHKPVEEHRD